MLLSKLQVGLTRAILKAGVLNRERASLILSAAMWEMAGPLGTTRPFRPNAVKRMIPQDPLS